MPVSLVNTPDPFALTKGGRMCYQFSGSGRYASTGVVASCLLFVAAGVPDNTKLELKWNGTTHSLLFVTAPSAPNEFTAGDGSAGYVTALLHELQGWFPLREDFILTAGDPSQLPGIVLTARKPGPAYDITAVLPVGTPFGFGSTTFGADPVLRVQYSIYSELWLQKVGTTGDDRNTDYERIFATNIECDAEGLAQFDVGNVLHSSLTPDWPAWNVPAHTLAQYSNRKYFVCYGEAYGFPIQIGRVQSDEIRFALLGGVDYLHKAGGGRNLLFDQTPTPAGDKALRFGPTVRYVRPDEPQFLTFLNARTTQFETGLLITRIFDDDSIDVQLEQQPAQDVFVGQKITFAVGPTQQDLLTNLPAGRTLKEYTVQRIHGDHVTPLSLEYRYILNYDYQPYPRYFAYLNSLGAVDTLTTFGKGSSEMHRFYEQAETYQPVLYEVSDGQFIDYNVSVQLSVEVATGFRSKSELQRWNDFYRSPERFRLVDNRALPIGLTSKSIKQAKDGDTLFSHAFQYTYLYKDDFYFEEADQADTLPPISFVGAGGATVVVQNTTVVNAVDKTVPDAVRGLTATIINKFQQAFAWGNHALAGYLTQPTASLLFRRKDQLISYVTDLKDKPTTRDQAGLTDVPTIQELFTLVHVPAHLTTWEGDTEPDEIDQLDEII